MSSSTLSRGQHNAAKLFFRMLRSHVDNAGPIRFNRASPWTPYYQYATYRRAFSVTAPTQQPRTGKSPFRSRFILRDADSKSAKKTVAGGSKSEETQERLEIAAQAVTESDEHYAKLLGSNAKTKEYINLSLSRILPILKYSLHHTDHEFIKGYGPVGSTLDRARDASTYLFISAISWAMRAFAVSDSRSENLDLRTLAAIVKLHDATALVDSYLKESPPEDVKWSTVGTEILAVCRLVWSPMSEYVERPEMDPSDILPDDGENPTTKDATGTPTTTSTTDDQSKANHADNTRSK